MTDADILKTLLTIVEKGGRLADSMIHDSRPSLKPDRSVLTRADKAVSALTRDGLKEYLAAGDHVLIDEEDPGHAEFFEPVMSGAYKYVWSVDPIDGTRAYSNRMPVYGVSLGVMRDGQPWMGAVFFPSLQEFFYCNGPRAFFVRNAFSPSASEQPISPLDQDITPQSIFLSSDRFLGRYRWDSAFCQILMPSVAGVALCWPAIGRGCGSYFEANLWDFAGAWPVFRAAGLELRSCKTGQPLDGLRRDAFRGKGAQTWRMSGDYILSSGRNYPLIQKHMKPFPRWLKA
ncbi:MAG: inositol monophosphatase family protein, partial [Candidatus Omnitrophota bacterium]